MIILYSFIDENRHKFLIDRYLNAFPEDFKKDILKYRRWQDAQLSLLGRVLLEHGLNAHYGIRGAEIGRLSNNKPFLKGHTVHFNISHSKNLVACAIADYPIGIDIEFSDDSINYLDFQFQMTAGEFEEIHQSEDQINSFFTYWTKKEAVLKAEGSGMMIPLDSFEILNNECLIEGKKFFTKEFFIDKRYHCCIASEEFTVVNKSICFELFQN
ncbi:4'-phosphopantetheinyl transferase superfamily protein [Chryseobacterium sp. WG23]|uniref:4'-phosphopantetheinyl transferase family protein n=1 Tax=Chryseobacterium sp. WG23 TaxID=2926910 RepID=UPI00211ECEF7|nr:4'-phosphopantetheinyl transferase superfamily protein [Chryseobacterium sp. WG23]MCQ9634350.1 4'-phosphopantetheinyl transferase superfamily protein [Chryseobacterium sp. WG23]